MFELPRWDAEPDDEARCLRQIDAWARALRDLNTIAEFSPADAARMRELSGSTLLDALESFAREHWDFRGGRERNLAVAPEFSAAQIAAVDAAAVAMGLSGTLPPRRREYDAVVMTGGMVRAGIVKPRYARELYDRGIVARETVFLGGFRKFAGDEVILSRQLGVVGDDEFDSMTAGMRFAFDLGEPDVIESSAPDDFDRGNAAWREESWKWEEHVLRVVAAPSSDPLNRRANTVDTFRFWAERAKRVFTVLVVTTPIYVPYQGAGAIEVLGLEFGISVETVAVSASASDLGALSQPFLPHHFAQELRSAIGGMRSLRAQLVAREQRA